MIKQISKTINEIKVGDQCIKEIYIEEDMGGKFAEISLDFNPIHTDASFAKTTPFEQKIAHGMLIASFFSGVIGTELPGIGAIYAKQDVMFKKPVYYNQMLKIVITVEEIVLDKNRVLLRTQCLDNNDEILVDGLATILPRK